LTGSVKNENGQWTNFWLWSQMYQNFCNVWRGWLKLKIITGLREILANLRLDAHTFNDIQLWLIHNNNTNNNYDWYTTTIYQLKYSRWNTNNCGAGTLGQEKRYMHINVHTLTQIYMSNVWRGWLKLKIITSLRQILANLRLDAHTFNDICYLKSRPR
jgi:hypothetical protein